MNLGRLGSFGTCVLICLRVILIEARLEDVDAFEYGRQLLHLAPGTEYKIEFSSASPNYTYKKVVRIELQKSWREEYIHYSFEKVDLNLSNELEVVITHASSHSVPSKATTIIILNAASRYKTGDSFSAKLHLMRIELKWGPSAPIRFYVQLLVKATPYKRPWWFITAIGIATMISLFCLLCSLLCVFRRSTLNLTGQTSLERRLHEQFAFALGGHRTTVQPSRMYPIPPPYNADIHPPRYEDITPPGSTIPAAETNRQDSNVPSHESTSTNTLQRLTASTTTSSPTVNTYPCNPASKRSALSRVTSKPNSNPVRRSPLSLNPVLQSETNTNSTAVTGNDASSTTTSSNVTSTLSKDGNHSKNEA